MVCMVCISGFCILVRFLHELLLPWFAVRNAIRCNDHKALDWSWSYFVPLFRATNKNQYAQRMPSNKPQLSK